MIEIRNLAKSFGKIRILNIEKMLINTLWVTAVRGENGLGKTTLFSLISGLELEFEGEIVKKWNRPNGYYICTAGFLSVKNKCL
ncbi:ATP-binding cassette domain-containing protein [uncultured Ilyobacter sp.]|uniref:ATP-binding cassette domain-containing protein n=1 Tax=uncultured Ilyobacter sp. TaxID=544433 RepID=UPI0029C6AE29|nr:ATP-binding cassette domain-containing protein [uncultured Ilyobacter sp.]